MIRIVVDAKNDGLLDNVCSTAASTMRFSRMVACSIHWRRHWLVLASTEGRTSARRLANCV